MAAAVGRRAEAAEVSLAGAAVDHLAVVVVVRQAVAADQRVVRVE